MFFDLFMLTLEQIIVLNIYRTYQIYSQNITFQNTKEHFVKWDTNDSRKYKNMKLFQKFTK